jgi:hypothetical protein
MPENRRESRNVSEKLAINRKARLDGNRRTDLPKQGSSHAACSTETHTNEATMRLSVLAAVGVTAFLGIMAIDAPNANAVVRDTSIVSGPRGTAVVNRTRGATILKGRRGTAVVSRGLRGARGAVTMSSPRRTIVRGRRGTTVVARTPGARGAVIVKGRRGTASMSRRLGARGAVIVNRPRGKAIVTGRRGAMIASRPRAAAVMRGARGSAACRSVIVNGVRKLRCT